jgi:hypothetical protein
MVPGGEVAFESGSPPAGRSSEARKLLEGLERELESSSQRLGQKLEWSAAERAILGLIAGAVDRRVELADTYERSEPKVKVKVSAELRLMEQSIARLLKYINTDPPAPKSLRSVKATRAARARWDRGHGA